MKNGINNEIQAKTTYINVVILALCLTGVLLRLFHYFYNRSLWMDEVYLSSSFLHFNYGDLATKALDHDQKAPLGFLWLVKLCVDLFGKNEMALRLIPLIAGIGSIFLFNTVSRHFLKPVPQLLALSIFVFAPALVYHSVEIKQYSTECLGTLVALYAYIKYKDVKNKNSKLIWGALGAVTLWFSYSAIFVFAGIAAGMTLYDLGKRNWKPLFNNLVPFTIWMISFGINYLLFTHRQAESDWVVYFFKTYDNFLPLPPHSIAELKWYPRNFLSMMDYPLGLVWNLQNFNNGILFRILAIPIIPILLLFAGMGYLFRKERRNFYVLILPVLLMLLASGLYLYPLLERFWVFIAPMFILCIGFGFEYLQNKINKRWISNGIFILVTIGPLVQSLYYLNKPNQFYKHKISFERESLHLISSNLQTGDAVYNYWNNYPGFDVYKMITPLKFKAVEGRDIRKTSKNLKEYNASLHNDFKQFTGYKRVWLIYNTQFLTDIGDYADEPLWYYKNHIKPLENLKLQFKCIGRPLKKVVYPDITVELYELK